MNEGLKALLRHNGDHLWNEVFIGDGLDVGLGDARIQREWYPGINNLQTGTGHYAQDVRFYKPSSFDFISVTERLEHEMSPFTAAISWLYLLKPGGHLVITVPDFNLYELGKWPSVFNKTHLWSFSIGRCRNAHRKHINILDLIDKIPGVQIRRIHLADSLYNYSSKDDQTLGNAEASIEIVLRKMPDLPRKRTFKHSGARGDLIYALPTIKALGGGTLYVNRKGEQYFGIPISNDEMLDIIEFLKTQPYIDDVREWEGQEVDCDLDGFRMLDPAFMLLSSSYLMLFGADVDLTKPWLETDGIKPKSKADIIVSRTDRYHSPFDWGELAPWVDRAAFVGSKAEHEEFIKRTGFPIRYEATENWMELAEVILGSKLFIGNQSFAYSLAEAMKHPRVLEVCLHCPNCDPQSDNGYVRLTQGVIRKYLLGEAHQEFNRVSRMASMQLPFSNKRGNKDDNRDISIVIIGKGDRVSKFEEDFKSMGLGFQIIIEDGETFETAANSGVEKSCRNIICFVDADLCENMASVVAVIKGILSGKAGLFATSTCCIGIPHVSGPCFAVTREAYEKAGLFNLSLRPGEAGMIEMCLRYERLGESCRSIGIPGWTGRKSNEDDESRNRAYMERNFGIKL